MLRPSGKRRMAPSDMAFFGGSLRLSIKFIPLTRCTRRSPASPVPYSRQQRQRAKIYGSKGRFGTSPCHVSQSRLLGERSGGGGYSQAPVGSFRPSEPSTSVIVPMMPCESNSRALAQITELTRCEPICTMRPLFCAAATIATPSATLFYFFFSYFISFPSVSASSSTFFFLFSVSAAFIQSLLFSFSNS